MIPLNKLSKLPAGQSRRKLALMLETMERTLAKQKNGQDISDVVDVRYVFAIVGCVIQDPKIETNIAVDLQNSLSVVQDIFLREHFSKNSIDLLHRLCNNARHILLSIHGTFPAEWDLVIETADIQDSRKFYPGISVYAEDIRSPFNIGSIFRTAEALGAEKIYVSPNCVAPDHPRSLRSAMGCVDYLPYQRASLESLPHDVPIFALETGGTPIHSFKFPKNGIVILGSEELGVSAEGLEKASYGRVSIPMRGIKASLNVGVAFGILLEAWTNYLDCSASKPF